MSYPPRPWEPNLPGGGAMQNSILFHSTPGDRDYQPRRLTVWATVFPGTWRPRFPTTFPTTQA